LDTMEATAQSENTVENMTVTEVSNLFSMFLPPLLAECSIDLLQAKRKLQEVKITFGQGKKCRLRLNVLSTLVDRAQKRIRGDALDQGSGDDDDEEPASKRQAILITVSMYCIICFDTSMMKLGITASEDQARDCNASTYYGTCLSKYFPIRVSLYSLSTLKLLTCHFCSMEQ